MSLWRNKEGRVRLVWRLAGIFLSAFILILAASFAVIFIGFSLGQVGETQDFLAAYGNHLSVLMMLISTALFAFVIDKMKFKDMGLGLKGRWGQLAFGLALGAGLVVLTFLLHLGLGYATIQAIDWPGALPAVLSGLGLFILVSLSEELLGRGYFLNHFSGRLDLAVLISSLFFAALHLGNPGITLLSFINLLLAGALFALMYLWSGSLWMPLGIHLTWNWTMGSILSYPVSGTTPQGLIRLAVEGPALITGGDFGPEGGLPVTLLLIMGVFLTRWYLQHQGHPCPWRARLGPELTPELLEAGHPPGHSTRT